MNIWRTKKIKNKETEYRIGCSILFIIVCAGLFILMCEILRWGFRVEEIKHQQRFETYKMLETKLKEQRDYKIAVFRQKEIDDITIVRGIIGEAIGESTEGIIAVSWVLRNRLDAGMNIGFCSLDREDLDRFISKQPKWKITLVGFIWQKVKMGQLPDPTKGALYFENVNAFGLPSWIEQVKLTVLIGNHRFYK